VFKKSVRFLWSPNEQTIYYFYESDNDYVYMFHELSHALLGHADYTRDVELLAMERDAWDKAVEIAKKYKMEIDDETVQSTLDTYRDWLHDRSTCPICGATGIQTEKYMYKCLECNHEWRVNEARLCALRRYKMKY
jgi:DNA-directed RNA polymerase subunit M/transcription elongation factor TFIIS